jgi:hypothetical protein
MARYIAVALAFPALLLVAGCGPQAGAGTASQLRAGAVTPTGTTRSQTETQRAGGAASFNPLDTGGAASTGGGAY